MITGVIGFGGFHHSIVDNIEVFGAFLHSETITFLDYLWFLILALLGNAIGGAIVVGLFKYRISNQTMPAENNTGCAKGDFI
jgi:formate/nitrite transporter FocA (FNT family)